MYIVCSYGVMTNAVLYGRLEIKTKFLSSVWLIKPLNSSNKFVGLWMIDGALHNFFLKG